MNLTKVLDTYLEPSQTSMMKFFLQKQRFLQKISIIDT